MTILSAVSGGAGFVIVLAGLVLLVSGVRVRRTASTDSADGPR